jgi:hypothetical protein
VDTESILCLLAAAGLIGLWLSIRKRQAAVRAMAKRRGFTYIGRTLPRSIGLHGTALQRANSVWNVVDGECGQVRVISFDCQIGQGKGSWRRTAIAAQALPEVFGSAFLSDVVIERSGDWSILYEPWKLSLMPSGLMPVSELEAHLDGIR